MPREARPLRTLARELRSEDIRRTIPDAQDFNGGRVPFAGEYRESIDRRIRGLLIPTGSVAVRGAIELRRPWVLPGFAIQVNSQLSSLGPGRITIQSIPYVCTPRSHAAMAGQIVTTDPSGLGGFTVLMGVQVGARVGLDLIFTNTGAALTIDRNGIIVSAWGQDTSYPPR